jgi:hypothetical protein
MKLIRIFEANHPGAALVREGWQERQFAICQSADQVGEQNECTFDRKMVPGEASKILDIHL